MTSFVGLQTLGKMIKHSSIQKLDDLAVEDVSNYAEYVHSGDCACIEGKMRKTPSPVFDNAQYSPHACPGTY